MKKGADNSFFIMFDKVEGLSYLEFSWFDLIKSMFYEIFLETLM